MEQWEPRSPINAVDRLTGRLLLIHGTADQRVPFASSKAFYDKALREGKEALCSIVPIEGSGHSFVAREAILIEKKAMLRFLSDI